MASGTDWRADVVRETTALMRCGTEATWMVAGGPREAQVVQRVRTRGRRPRCPHMSTWAPVWGATW